MNQSSFQIRSIVLLALCLGLVFSAYRIYGAETKLELVVYALVCGVFSTITLIGITSLIRHRKDSEENETEAEKAPPGSDAGFGIQATESVQADQR